MLPTALPLREFYAHFSRLYGAIEPLRRGIQGYGDSLDEVVVRNVQKVLQSMGSGAQAGLSSAERP